jgi:hypothetical protein
LTGLLAVDEADTVARAPEPATLSNLRSAEKVIPYLLFLVF